MVYATSLVIRVKQEYELLHGLTQEHLVPYEDTFLHKDILEDWLQFKEQASKQGLDLFIISGYRNFERQKTIWNRKLHNLDTNDHIQLEKRLEQVLRFSAIPGMSRHHWGTDFDLGDRKPLIKHPTYQISLEQHEYEDEGIFAQLGEWLNQVLTKDFPFYRPYAKDHGGVAVEPWHLSHRQSTQPFARQLTLEQCQDFLTSHHCDDLIGKEYLQEHLEQLFKRYLLPSLANQ